MVNGVMDVLWKLLSTWEVQEARVAPHNCLMQPLHFFCAKEPPACVYNSLANQEAIIFVNCAQTKKWFNLDAKDPYFF